MITARHQALTCPECDSMLDASTCVTEKAAKPAPGDYTVCLHCAAPLEYGDDLKLRRLDVSTVAPEDFRIIARTMLAVLRANTKHWYVQ